MIAAKKITAFLNDLNELTRQHGIVIGGCGCCGSPYLMSFADSGSWLPSIDTGHYHYAESGDDGYPDKLQWIEDSKES